MFAFCFLPPFIKISFSSWALFVLDPPYLIIVFCFYLFVVITILVFFLFFGGSGVDSRNLVFFLHSIALRHLPMWSAFFDDFPFFLFSFCPLPLWAFIITIKKLALVNVLLGRWITLHVVFYCLLASFELHTQNEKTEEKRESERERD